MTRISTLLPAFALAGANLAMAANAGTDRPNHSTSVHVANGFKTTTKAATSDPIPCTAGQAICSSEGY